MTMSLLNSIKAKLTKRQKSNGAAAPLTFSQDSTRLTPDGGQEMTCAGNQDKNLVVASMDSRFTPDMIDYALEMAGRMDFGIIAVNAANLTHDVTEFFSTSHEELFRDFQEEACKNVRPFKQKALERGLKFAHATKYSDIDHAIDEITSACGDIEFIITENKEPAPVRDAVSADNRIAQRLFVYAVD